LATNNRRPFASATTSFADFPHSLTFLKGQKSKQKPSLPAEALAKAGSAYDGFATTLIPSLSAVALAKAVISRNPSRSGFIAN
jgi:hypothetical protein